MYLALGDGPPGFPWNSTCSMVLGDKFRESWHFRVRGCHPLWPRLSSLVPLTSTFVTLRQVGTPAAIRPATPSTPTRTGLQRKRFGLLPFRSPLLRQSLFYFLFLRLLRWFSSPRILPQPMDSVEDIHRWMGCPIRKSPDQCVFAAPRSLSQLAASFFGSQCQGIRRVPLVS